MIPLRAADGRPISSLAGRTPSRANPPGSRQCRFGSRRSIERWVAEGRITVDGRVAKFGEQLQGGRVCFTASRFGSTREAGPPRRRFHGVLQAGRTRGADEDKRRSSSPAAPRALDPREPLDRNTSGLSVLTTDGELASRLMHPSTVVERDTPCDCSANPRPRRFGSSRGIELDTGLAKTRRSRRPRQWQQRVAPRDAAGGAPSRPARRCWRQWSRGQPRDPRALRCVRWVRSAAARVGP